jgi:hypothetical protein
MAHPFKSKAQAIDYTRVKRQKQFPTLGDPLRGRHNTAAGRGTYLPQASGWS